MAATKDNIFDAQRDRRIQNLQQQSVSNIVKTNPNLRGVLTRYEDAEVSRLKLLELQRLRSKKITAGERALLKVVAKRSGKRSGGRVGRGGKKVKVKRRIPDYSGPLAPDGTPLTTKLVEVEEFVGKDQQIGEGGSKDPIDPELERDKLRLEQDKLKQQRETAREERIQRRELAARERGQRQIQFEELQRLENRRLNIQQQQIETHYLEDRERQRTEQDRIAADVERYNLEARRAEANRDRDIGVAQRQLQDVQERVARDDAFRHAQLQETQKLALEQLAAQQRDNERRHQLEQNRIDNQRQVDADRAVSDRELIGNLSSRITQLERKQTSQELPTGRGLVEDLDTSSGQVQPASRTLKDRLEPEPEPELTLSSQTVSSKPSQQRADTLRRVEIQEATTSGRVVKKPKRFEGGATEEEIEAELASTSSLQQTTPTTGSTLKSTPEEEQAIAQAYRGEPEVYKPKVKTLAEVRAENPVIDIGD